MSNPCKTLVMLFLLVATVSGANNWETIWTQGGFEDERGTAVCMDDELNVYMAGWALIDGRGDADMVVAKYDAAGVEQWYQTWDAGLNNVLGYDEAIGTGVDDAGNVYVVGRGRYQRNSSQDYDFITIKYSPSGVEQWVRNYDYLDGSDPNGEDIPVDMAVDGTGNVWIVGNSDDDYLTVKYNTSGVKQWDQRYVGDYSGSASTAIALALDDSGNCYITGYSQGINAHWDMVTISYGPGGGERWKTRYEQVSIHSFKAQDIAVSAQGTVAVTGYANFSGIDAPFDALTVLYSNSGTELWDQTWSGTGHGGIFDDFGRGVTFASDGSVLVGGEAYMAGNESDFLAIKYSPSGVEQWAHTYNEVPTTLNSSYDLVCEVGVDSLDRLYVAGSLMRDHSGGTWQEYDYSLLRYDSDGTLEAAFYYDQVAEIPNDERAFKMAINAGGDVAITGESWGMSTFYDIATVFFASDLIFADGFETGGTSRWSSTVGAQ